MPATLRAPLDFADHEATGKSMPFVFVKIDFMRLAEIVHQAILRMGSVKLPAGVSREQMSAMAITQLFSEHLEALCE